MRSRRESSGPAGTRQPQGLRRWWLDRSLRSKGLIVIAIPLVALVATTLASPLLENSQSQERTASISARNLTSAANLVLADLLNAESSVRGYAAVPDTGFLAPYNLTLTRIGADRAALREAAAVEGAGRQERAVDASTTRILADLAQLRTAVGRGVSLGPLRLAMQRQETAMDLLRRQVGSLTAGSTAATVVQHNKINRLATIIDLVSIVGLALGLLAGLAGIALFTSGVSRRVRENAMNAVRLGTGQRLEPAPRAGDEIGLLSESLSRAGGLLTSRNAELTTALHVATSATQAKNSFLSSTSHELRTPLNSILGFTQLLEMSELSGEDADSVGRILGAGRHLLALINELIDIARIESGDLSLSLEPVLVRAVIEETSELMAPIAAERAIRIIQQCAHPALAVRADRQRVSQILVNLISNAVKYNHRGGTITISCQEGNTGQATIVVSDTGPGISPENIERIFVPFERLGADLTAVEGTGIGLPLARALTDAMDGRLTATSVPGEGSVFVLSLPRVPDLVHVPAPGLVAAGLAAGPHPPAGPSVSVLYVDDNPANVEVVSRFLQSRPNTTLMTEASGRAGIERAGRDVPDIVLLDLHLPDLHGDQVLSELKTEPATAAISVVVLSADASPGVIRRLLASGALAYLTKPIELAELGELLDTFAATRAQDRQAQPAFRIVPA
jgi:signal transduction histidine kinase/ActR/RegA family two-component response regulator